MYNIKNFENTDSENILTSPEDKYKVLRNLNHRNIELYLLSCGIESCRPCHTFGPGSRDKFLIHVILSGKGEFRSAGQYYELTKNQAFFVYPHQEVYYRADPDNPWTYMWVSFNGALADTYLTNAGFDENTHVFTLPEDSGIPDIINQMLEAEERTYANEIYRQGLLLQLLSKFISYNDELEVHEGEDSYCVPCMLYTERATTYIQNNYMHDISITDLATHMGITRSYLTKCFKTTISMSPKQYLINYRMEKACDYLKTTSLGLADIAEKVGYSNSLAFSKAFKNLYNISPGEWRTRAAAYKNNDFKQQLVDFSNISNRID